jgi:ABC-type nickel/cobalt efflux system permease component RcnA
MDSNLIGLLGGAFLLSCLHGLIPNHWVPFVILGRDRKWDTSRIVLVTLLGGVAHLSSTVLIGVAIGIAGYAISLRYEAILRWAAPAILAAAGLWILLRGHDRRHGAEHAEADPSHDQGHDKACESHHQDHTHFPLGTRDLVAIGTLCAMMFLSPCLELEAYYPVAAHRGWLGIATVSVVYMIVTVGVMMVMAGFAARSLEQVRWSFLARHERQLSGGLLIALGVVWLLFPL